LVSKALNTQKVRVKLDTKAFAKHTNICCSPCCSRLQHAACSMQYAACSLQPASTSSHVQWLQVRWIFLQPFFSSIFPPVTDEGCSTGATLPDCRNSHIHSAFRLTNRRKARLIFLDTSNHDGRRFLWEIKHLSFCAARQSPPDVGFCYD